MCCLHAARWNTGRKISPKFCRLGTIAQLCRAVSSQIGHVSTIGKKLLNSNICSICVHNIANVGPLTAEIGSVVWGTPARFNGFRVLASLLQRRRSPEANQTLHDVWPSHGRGTRNGLLQNFRTGCHLYSAGRPSRGALAHILVTYRCAWRWKSFQNRSPFTEVKGSSRHIFDSLSVANMLNVLRNPVI